MSGAGAMGFRWLEVLEKDFDKAFVDLDILLGDIDEDQHDLVLEGRERLTRLSAAFAQLAHKSESIFHQNSHLETQLVAMRSETCQLRSLKTVLERQINDLVYQIHDTQLQLCHSKESSAKDASSPLRNGLVDPDVIRQKLADHKLSHQSDATRESETLDQRRLAEELNQVKRENAVWKQQALTLRGEVIGAKLAAKYSAKELAGRVQQLQLLIREKEMKLEPEMQQKLWNQLEAEINLHRHKTIIRECRSRNGQPQNYLSTAAPMNGDHEDEPKPGELRTAIIKKGENQKTMGLSITGGTEHGVPILISEIHPGTAAADCGRLFVGDAIIFVNGSDLREVPHEDAVKILSEAASQQEIMLEVIYIHPDPDELATREGESRAEVAQEIAAAEYPIFDASLLRGLDGLTVETSDEYSFGADPHYWDPNQPPFVNVEPPDIVIDDGRQQHLQGPNGVVAHGDGGVVEAADRPGNNLQPVVENELSSDGASSPRSAVITVTEAIVPSKMTLELPPPPSAPDATAEPPFDATTTRIGSRLSQHSNPQTLDISQLRETPPATDGTDDACLSVPRTTPHRPTADNDFREISADQNPAVAAAVRQNDRTQAPTAIPTTNSTFSNHETHAPLRNAADNADPPPPTSAPPPNGELPPSIAGRGDSAPRGLAPGLTNVDNTFPPPLAYSSYSFQGSDSAPQIPPNTFSLNGGDKSTAGAPQGAYPGDPSTVAGLQCAYPYPRDREQILKGAMMLSPSIAGLRGVSQYYLPPSRGAGENLNQSPPPIGYKNRDTKILY